MVTMTVDVRAAVARHYIHSSIQQSELPSRFLVSDEGWRAAADQIGRNPNMKSDSAPDYCEFPTRPGAVVPLTVRIECISSDRAERTHRTNMLVTAGPSIPHAGKHFQLQKSTQPHWHGFGMPIADTHQRKGKDDENQTRSEGRKDCSQS